MNIPCSVPDGVSGDWRVETFAISEEDIRLYNLRAAIHGDHRYMSDGTYKRLMCGGTLVMSNTPSEIRDHLEPIRRANGKVLINGLGLGVVLQGVLDKTEVTHVTVIEISQDVIKLVAPTYTSDPRVTIVNADAYTWKPPKGVRYNVVWHDIWYDMCADNLDEMAKLHRKYGRRCDWQGSWGKRECLYGRFGRYR